MTTSIKSALCKFINRIKTDSGFVNLFEYKVQISNSRILINAPWRINDLRAWLLEVERLLESNQDDYPASFKNAGFVEVVVNRYKDVWERRVSSTGEYKYIFYAVVGEFNDSLCLLRAFIEADRERFHAHTQSLEETQQQPVLSPNLLETQEVHLGRTIDSYLDLNAAP